VSEHEQTADERHSEQGPDHHLNHFVSTPDRNGEIPTAVTCSCRHSSQVIVTERVTALLVFSSHLGVASRLARSRRFRCLVWVTVDPP